jgi:PKD repeat protein
MTQGYAAINAQASVAADLEPSTPGVQIALQANLNDIIDVAIVAQDVTDLDSFDIELTYNPFRLKLDPNSIAPGDFIPLDTTDFFMKDISKPGRISLSYSLPGQDPNEAPDGTGVIATMQFTLIGGGEIPIQFTKVLLFDSNRERDDVTSNSPVSTVTGPDPNAQNLIVTVNPTTTALGDVVTVQVEIQNAVNLDSYDFKVTYNPFKLKLIEGSVSEGSFLQTTVDGESFFQADTSKPGEVWLSNSLPGQNPEEAPDGDGLLAAMQFKVIGGGDIPIDIVSPLLFDSERSRFTPSVTPAMLSVPRPTPAIAVDLDPTANGIQDALTVAPGDAFDVEVVAIDVTNLDSFDFKLIYDPQYLEVVQDSATEGSFLTTSADGEVFLQVDLSTPGVVHLSNSLPGQDPEEAPDGTGPIVRLSFRSLASGSATLTCSDVIFFDSERIRTDVTDIRDATVRINASPVAVLGTYTVNEGETLTLDASGSYDPDGTIVSYRWDLDNDGQYDDATGPMASVSYSDDGSFTVRVEVTDNDGGYSSSSTTVTVTNKPPVLGALGPFSGDEGVPITLTATAVDVPADVLTYSWDLDGDGEYDDATGATVDYTFPDNGTYTVGVSVTDDDGGSATGTATVTVNNVPPVADADGPYEGTAGEPIQLQGAGADVSADTLTYEWDLNYDGATFDVDSTEQNPTVTYDSAGTYTVALRVIDDDGGVSELSLSTVTVLPPPNRAPELAEIADQTINEGETLGFVVTAVDPDGDPVTLSATELPEGAGFDPVTGQFTFTPNFEQAGEYDVTFTATDNRTPPLSDEITVHITVLDVVNALVLSVTPTVLKADGTSTADVVATLISNGQSTPGAIVEMTITQGTGDLSDVTDNGDGTYSAVYTAGTISGDVEITATAPDYDVSDTATIRLDGDGPTITQITGDTQGTTGEVVEIVLTAQDLTEPISANIYLNETETPMGKVGPGEFRYQVQIPLTSVDPISYYVIASDGLGNTTRTPEEGTYTIAVTDNDPPIAEAGPDQRVELGRDVTFDGRGSTDNIGIVSYKWDVDASDGVDFESPDLTGPNPTLTGGYTAFGTYTVTLQVEDAAGNTATDTLLVEVPDTIPPYVQLDPITSPTNQTSLTVTGTVYRMEDNQPESGDAVNVMLNGIVMGTTTSGDDGTFSVEITDLAEGIYQVTATAADAFDNVSAPAGPAELIVDVTPPEISVLTPADGATVLTKRPTILATLTDNLSGILPESVTMAIEDGGRRLIVNPSFDPTTNQLIYKPVSDLANRLSYIAAIGAMDRAGNLASVTSSFTVNVFARDTEPPSFSGFKPEDGSLISDAQPLLSVTIRDPSGIQPDSVSISLKDSTGADVAVAEFSFDESTGVASAKPSSPLADGSYTVEASAKDGNDNEGSAAWSFTVDSTPPEKPVVDQPMTPTNQSDLTATGTAEPGSTVKVFLNDELAATVQADSNTGAFSANLTLAEGMNRITALAVDGVGNEGDLSDLVQVLLDTIAPIISNLSPTMVTGVLNPVITATIIDPESSLVSGVDPDSIELKIDGETVTGFTYDPLSGQLTYQAGPFENMTQHEVELGCADNAGNAATPITSMFLVNIGIADEMPPTIRFSVKEGDVIPSSTPEFSVAFADADTGVNPDTIEIRLDGSPIEDYVLDEETGVATFTPQSPLADGLHAISASVSDNATPPNFTEAAVSFTVKTQVPKPVLDELPAFVAQGLVDVSGTAEPSTIVTLYVNGKPIGTVQANDEGKFERRDVPLKPGMNAIEATATDAWGNVSPKSDPAQVGYDDVEPAAGGFSPANGSRVKDVASISVRLTDEISGVNPDTLLMSINGAPVEVTFSDGLVEHNVPDGALGEGTYLVMLYAEDNVGNSMQTSWEFTVDRTPPGISALSPSDGSTISNTSPTLFAAISGDDVHSVEMYLFEGDTPGPLTPGNAVAAVYDPLAGQMTYEASLADGTTYTFLVVATDVAGNSDQAQSTFSVDTAQVDQDPPLVVNLYPAPGSLVNIMAFQIISAAIGDGDTGVNWDTVKVYINGVQVSLADLGWSVMRSAVSLNRLTGRLTIDVKLLQEQGENPLRVGENDVRIEAEDKAGNPTQQEWSFTVVTEAPEKPTLDPITSPTNVQVIDVTGTVANVTAENPITVAVLVNGVVAGTAEVNPDDGTFKVENVVLVKGTNTITAYASDEAGNQSEPSDPLSVVLDQTPPEVRFIMAKYTSKPEALLLGWVDEELSELTVILNGERNAITPALSFEWTATLKEGENIVQIEAVDLAGNKTLTDPQTVYLDIEPPTQKPTGLSARVALDGKSVLLSWNATEDAAKFNVYRSGEPIASVQDASLIAQEVEGTEYRDVTAQIDRTYFYAVTPIDAAGNEGKEALSDNVALRIFRSTDAAAVEYPDLASVQLGEGLIPGGASTFKTSLSIAPVNMTSISGLGTVLKAFNSYIYGQDGLLVERLSGEAVVRVPIPATVDFKRFMPTLYCKVNDQWVAVESQSVNEADLILTAQVSQLGSFALVLVQTARPFTLTLNAGLNLFSVPVNDPSIATIADLMEAMGDSVRFILRYDTEKGRFEVLLPGDPKATQISVSGSEGYLTSLKDAVTLDLEGYVWDGTVSIHKGINLVAMPVKPAEPMKLSEFMTYFGDAITLLLWFDAEENKFRPLTPQTAGSRWDVDVQGGAGYLVIAKSDATYTFEGEVWSTEEGAAAPAIALSSPARSPLIVVEGDLTGAIEGVNVRVENVTKGINESAEVESGGFAVALMRLGLEHEVGDLIKVTVDGSKGYCAEPVLHRITPEEIAAGLVRIKIQLRPTPKRTALLPNYPNPFNPETWIPFQLAKESDVKIRIYDMTGKLIRTLNLGHLRAGYYTSRHSAAHWDGRNEMGERVASGVYIYQMRAGDKVFARKMVILK